MSAISKRDGIDLELRKQILQRDKAMSAAAVLNVSPATLGSSAAAVTTAIAGAGFTRNVAIELRAADGTLHDWFDGTFVIGIADTAAGAATIVSTTATFVNGRCVIVITYTGAWANTNTSTLTITGGTLLGFTVADKTSVDTLIA